MPIDYFKESEKFKPAKIEKLLIAECPPPSGESYFYVPEIRPKPANIRDDRSLPSTIFNHYFMKRPDTEKEYFEMLLELKKIGIFLIDISDEPMQIRDNSQRNGINRENFDRLINEIPNLRNKIRTRNIHLEDENIIFLLPRLNYKRVLKEHFPNSSYYTWIEFRLS